MPAFNFRGIIPAIAVPFRKGHANRCCADVSCLRWQFVVTIYGDARA
jgi:hypothetical protein